MNESQIEIRAEKMMDRADREYLSGLITSEQYDNSVLEIQAWAVEKMMELESEA